LLAFAGDSQSSTKATEDNFATQVRDTSSAGRKPDDSPKAETKPIDPVEAALATALQLAAEAGRFDVVQTLAAELHARRLANTSATTNVIPLPRRGAP
jgi:hypothetical protein